MFEYLFVPLILVGFVYWLMVVNRTITKAKVRLCSTCHGEPSQEYSTMCKKCEHEVIMKPWEESNKNWKLTCCTPKIGEKNPYFEIWVMVSDGRLRQHTIDLVSLDLNEKGCGKHVLTAYKNCTNPELKKLFKDYIIALSKGDMDKAEKLLHLGPSLVDKHNVREHMEITKLFLKQLEEINE